MDLYILRHILSFVCDMDWDTFSRLRVLNRAISRWLMSTYWFRPFNRLYPTRSFVSCNICMSCDRVSASLKSFTMPNTYFPRPVFVYCNRFNCIRTAVRSMVAYANDSNTVLLINEAVHTQFGKVLRSSEEVYTIWDIFLNVSLYTMSFCINLARYRWVRYPTSRRQYRLLTL